MFSDSQLAAAVGCPLPRASHWRPHLIATLQRFDILTPRRIAAFLAQLGHESLSLSRVEENLNYSAQRLLEVFPTYFSAADAREYARQRDRIANRVYANRLGNGPERSGDGWRYRGRGLIQVTGLDNYVWIGGILGLDLASTPELLTKAEHATSSAGAYWHGRGLNALADSRDFLALSRKINLGTTRTRRTPNGFQDRVNRWNRVCDVLEAA